MRVLKWSFFTTTLLCFLLWSGYYSIQTDYVLENDSGEQSAITAVKIEDGGEKEFFKFNKYKKTTIKSDNSFTSGIRADAETKRHRQSDEANNINKRTKQILKTFKTKPGVSTNNAGMANTNKGIFKDTHNAKTDISNKATFGKIVGDFSDIERPEHDLTDNEPGQTDQISERVPSTSTTELYNGIKHEDRAVSDTVDSVSGIIGDKSGRYNFSRNGHITFNQPLQNRKQTPWQHTRARGSNLDSRLEKIHDYSVGKRISPANRLTSLRRKPQRRTFDIPFDSSIDSAVPDLQSLRINKTHNATFVLLVTYARSGSTWLGEITNQAPETFYVFEPLQKFVVQGYYKENLVCFNNNTCREPRSYSETHNFAIITFHRLFTCQFTKLHPNAFNIFIKNLKSRTYARTFKSCFVTLGSLRKCQQRLEDICTTTSHRILKSIRISMELVNIMMNLWPNLKIVHLVRDPRGITSSRLNSKTFAMVKQLVPHSTDLCNRMLTDVRLNNELNKKYINRLSLVFYESLAERPFEGVKFIYKFLDMKLSQDVMNWVHNSTHAQTKSGYYGTMRSDSVKNAYQWRTRLTLFKIKIVDKNCLDVYKSLGFMTLDSTDDLINFSIPTRRTMSHTNWFS